MARCSTLIHFCITLAISTVVAAETRGPVRRQTNVLTGFTGTADQIENYDPHDYVPESYSRVRVIHAVLMTTVWLLIFPIGGIIPRVMSDPRFVWVHAIMQMVGFWVNVGAAAMGIWMAKTIDHLGHYHPIIGMFLLGLLAIQPATEILNHRFYQRHPRMIVTAHIHLWLGRTLLVAGAIQGGLGFLFAASFRNAVVDTWPRIVYTLTALGVWVIYIAVGIIYPEVRTLRKDKRAKRRTQVVAAGEMETLRTDSVGTAQAPMFAQETWQNHPRPAQAWSPQHY